MLPAVALLTSILALPSRPPARRLSFTNIAEYQPGSQVTDHANIDLDQEAIDDAVGTPDFERAKKIYEMGAHSKPTATCKLVTPANLLTDTKKGDAVKFTSVGSDNVQGKAYKNYDANTTSTFLFTYPVSSDQVQPEESRCYEGGLAVNKWSSQGCIANSNTGLSTFNLNGHDYTANCTNSGKRTLQGFSTKAYDVMWACSPMVDPNATYRVGCPYTSYAPYYEYYQEFDYGNVIVMAALDQKNTSTFANFAQFFETIDDDKRKQLIKKGTAYINAWMYAIREFEDAIDDCHVGDIYLNSLSSGPVHAWDEGVAFYIGSLVQYDMLAPAYKQILNAGHGVMAWTLANKRCANFGTCGEDNNEFLGQAYVNHELMNLFKAGKDKIYLAECAAIPPMKDKIVSLMTVPLVQGALRYAYKTSIDQGANSAVKAEAAIFAASVLPQVYNCSQTAAETIAAELNINSDGPVNFMNVKNAFESCYDAMGITCQQVGTLYNTDVSPPAPYIGTDPSGNAYDTTACGPPPVPPDEEWKASARAAGWRPCTGSTSSSTSRRRLAESLEALASTVH